MWKLRQRYFGSCRHRYIGGKHTDINNLKKGFSKDKHKLIEKAINELIKEGLIGP